MIARIPLRAAGNQQQTFYNRCGDWFPIACCGIGLGVLAATGRARKPLPQPERENV